MTDPIYKKPLHPEKSILMKIQSSETALVIFLVLLIGLFQAFYFKTQFFLREGGDYNVLATVLSSDGLFNLAVTAIVVIIHLFVVRILRQIIPEERVKARYLIQFILSGIFAATGASISMWFYYTVLYDFDPPSADIFFNISVLAIIIPIILNGLLETFYYRGAWLKEQYEQEQANRKMIAAKFEALKNQLSPHFVFNSFNTLAALIEQDTVQAQNFLEQLSRVYRYILDNKDKEFVALDHELDSMNALLAIQEARHPGAVKINIKISEKERDLNIIPLTLHTLVENVFKHNSLSPITPIILSIKINNNELLIVENNVNPKLDVQSYNIGIENLSQRYELLIRKGLNIKTAHNMFRVEIPLIEHQVTVL
ncbi:MAG: histidine kinase [Kordiimonadaceae bacterium]|nr:histidine kinase [Kordiimonadaceae bacterium]